MSTQTLVTALHCFHRAVEILGDKPGVQPVTLQGAARPEEPDDRRNFLPGTTVYERALIIDVPGPVPWSCACAAGTLVPSGAIKHERDLPMGRLSLFRLTDEERHRSANLAATVARILAQPSDHRTSFLNIARGGDVAFYANDDFPHLGGRAIRMLLENRVDITHYDGRPDQLACFRYDSNTPALLAQLLGERLFPQARGSETAAAT